MDRHSRFTGITHPITLFRLGQDDGGPALVHGRGAKCRVQLCKVMAAALQRIDLRYAHVCDERAQLRCAAEEPLEIVFAVVGAERLILPVRRVGECA